MTESLQDRVIAAIGEHYELDSEIGRGGMSIVYGARDLRLNRPVAIKVLPPELAHDAAIRARFTREAQTSAQLNHPHIVPIYDVGERDGIAYFVMAHVTGGNLATHLMREPRQPADEVRRILAELGDALAYAHLRGVIHRDIKPDNVLLDRLTGRVMVTDFGIAWAMEAGARLTATGIAVGTPTYMSPEQAMGERALDGRSDIYSAGVLGYQMLTGRVPFEAANSMALLLKHVTERPRPISELRPDVPRGLREIIERAMSKAPEDRWPSASALRDALLSNESSGPSWRSEQREPVKYESPRPDGSRRLPAVRSPAPVSREVESGMAALEPAHLAGLTLAQRADLRLWHGRVNLLERISAQRLYSLLTVGASIGGALGFAFGVADMPPLVLTPIIPIYMWTKLVRRSASLRESGIGFRQWFPRTNLTVRHEDPAIRKARDERGSIGVIFKKLPKSDRKQLGGLAPTVKLLVARVTQLSSALRRLDASIDPSLGAELETRIRQVERDTPSVEGERQLTFLHRQRSTLDELVERRLTLIRQLESAVLALGSLRLDLLKLQSSGLESALSDVSLAIEEARALSSEIEDALQTVPGT
jgi:serine/threonine protein kinase